MDKYIIEFSNADGELVSIELTDTAATTSDEYHLTPAEEPLIISQTDSDDPLTPIRTTQAEISVIANYHIFDIVEGYNMRVIVRVGGNIAWLGWIKPEAYTQDFSDREDEITLNAIDDLERAIEERIWLDRDITFAGVIWQANYATLGGYQRTLYAGDGMPLDETLARTLRIRTNPANWVDSEQDGEILAKTIEEFLTEWMKLFGCTFASDGLNWHIQSPEDVCHYVAQFGNRIEDFLLHIDNAELEQIDTTTIFDLSPAGDHTIATTPACKSITVKSGGESVDDKLVEIDTSELNLDYCGWMMADNAKKNKVGWYGKHYTSKQGGRIQLYRRNFSSSAAGGEWGSVVYPHPALSNYNPLGILGDAWGGAVFASTDYFETDTPSDQGSGSDADKKNLSLNPRLYLLQCSSHGTIWQWQSVISVRQGGKYYGYDLDKYINDHSATLATFKSKKPVMLRKGQGAIEFDFKAYGKQSVKLFYDNGDSRNYLSPMREGQTLCNCLAVRIRIGDKVLTNSGNSDNPRWYTPDMVPADEFRHVRVPVVVEKSEDFAKINSNKSYRDQWQAEGWCIPITEDLSGFVEVTIIGAYYYTYEGVGNTFLIATPPMVFIEDFKINYCPPIEIWRENNEPTREVKRDVNSGGDEEYSIQTSLCSAIGLAENAGMMLGSNGAINEMMCGDFTSIPEELTASRAQRLIGKKRTIYTICHKGDAAQFVINGTDKIARLATSEKNMRTNISTTKFLLL